MRRWGRYLYGMASPNNARLIDRREFALKFLQLAAALAVPPRLLADVARGELDVIVRRDVMIAMRDGVKLATDIYLPARNGQPLDTRAPVILERTPYGKSGKTRRHASEEIANIYASHGYAVVFQDCRGRGNSQGEYVKYLSDGRDGYDCCAWIVKQPWCNGRIGTQGLSYGAHTTAALACLDAPGLAAMFIDSGGFSNAYQGGIRQGGAFELKQVTWAFNAALEAPEIRNDPAKRAALQAIDIKEWFGRMPWSRGHSPLSLVPEYEDYVFDQWEHGVFDDYWKQVGIYAEGFYDRFSDVPIIWMSSWYDPYPRTATDNYVALARRKRSPQRLILGPWTHGNNADTFAGDVDFGPAATARRQRRAGLVDAAAALVRPLAEGRDRTASTTSRRCGSSSWVAAPAARTPRGAWITAGGGAQRQQWPLAEARADAVLSAWRRRTAPRQRRRAASPPRVYDYDPRASGPDDRRHRDVGTTGDGRRRVRSARGSARSSARARRTRRWPSAPDVLVFQTPPLESDVEITGPIEARAVDRLELPGHGLHDQADRRVSAERGLSAGIRDEPHRRHPALSLSRFVGAPDAA